MDLKETQLDTKISEDTCLAVDLEDDKPALKPSCIHQLEGYRQKFLAWFKCHKKSIKLVCHVILAILYLTYVGFALSLDLNSNESVLLICLSCFLLVWMCTLWIWPCVKTNFAECTMKLSKFSNKYGRKINWLALVLVYITVVIIFLLDLFYITRNTYNLVSLSGLIILLSLCFLFSHSPLKVDWRPVLWGIALQYVFALVVLRWSYGLAAFQSLGDIVAKFLSHSNVGAEMVFGESYMDHYVVFVVLPVVVFFSSVISVLYHLGWMQAVISRIGWLLQCIMGTTPAESVCAAGNIFVGMTESPLMIRPLLQHMTTSELHAVMTSGFATIAGSVMAAYILFGVPANHLISASVMSAPAALAVSKLFYPETEPSGKKSGQCSKINYSPSHNLIEAISSGASQSIKLVAQIAVNILAFVSLLHLVNAALTWFGERVNIDDPPLTFELISSYVFYPLAMILGASLPDCRIVAELIGIKIFINEFVSYDRLGVFISNKQLYMDHVASNGSYAYLDGDIVLYNHTTLPSQHPNTTILQRGILSDRSELISTYALCGFSNIAAMGISLGSLGAMIPSRRADLAKVVCRAIVAGNVACFMTACVAGRYVLSRKLKKYVVAGKENHFHFQINGPSQQKAKILNDRKCIYEIMGKYLNQ